MTTNLKQATTPADLALTLFNLRADATKARAALKKIEEMQASMEAQLLAELTKFDETDRSIRCKLGTVKAVWKSKPEIENPNLFHQHILATGELDLLQNRPHVGAIRERWERGERVPGVKRDDYLDLSFSTAPQSVKD